MADVEGIAPIITRFMRPNYLFALQFDEGFVFGRVIRRRIQHYKPYYLIDSNGNAVTISAASAQGELRFRDPRNTQNDILFLDTTTDIGLPWFMYGSIGIQPAQIYIYLRSPEGKDVAGKFPNLDPIVPANGDKLGYVSSVESPYEEPTDFVELVIPPNMHVDAEYYNKDPDRAIRPAMNLLFSTYWFEALQPGPQNPLIGKIARREVNASFFTVGFGESLVSLGTTVKSDWEVQAITIDQAEGLR